MDQPAGGALRWTRAAFLAGVAMLTGTVAHVSAGGYLPGAAPMVWIFLACLAASACLLGRPASRLRVTLMLMAGQTFIHGALTAMGGHRGDPPLTATPRHCRAPLRPRRSPRAGGSARSTTSCTPATRATRAPGSASPRRSSTSWRT